MAGKTFQFKEFSVTHGNSSFAVGIDAILLGAWADHSNPQTILDIGTGSGLIALQLAQRFPQASVTAVEINEEAAKQAEENFKGSKFGESLKIIQGDVLSINPLPPAPSPQAERRSFPRHSLLAPRPFDLIVCNPPYFDEPILSPAEHRAKARHATVTLPYNLLLKKVAVLLDKEGRFSCVLAHGKCKAFIKEAELNKLKLNRLTNIKHTAKKDYSVCLMEFSFKDIPVEITELVLYKRDGERTEDYLALVGKFYL